MGLNLKSRETKKALAVGAAVAIAACIVLPPKYNPLVIITGLLPKAK